MRELATNDTGWQVDRKVAIEKEKCFRKRFDNFFTKPQMAESGDLTKSYKNDFCV